jgi:transglutaminase-like putative cysteine protease
VKLEQQLPRNALVWIIIAQLSLVAPHVQRIPVWILGVYMLAAIWRLQVHAGRWSFPGRWVKAALILTSFAGIYFSFGSVIGLEPTVALLLAAFALKLIELVKRKDAYVILFLAYFVCVTEFLFSQDLLIVLYSLLNIVLITTALIALHKPGDDRFNFGTIRLASIMLAQSVPLMLVLFFLFPRIAPLWAVPIKSQTAKTGVSDFMRPGDISNLSLSDEVAFRAQFEGDIPSKSDLYWRGLVFSQLRDGAWSSLHYYDTPSGQRRQVQPTTKGEPLRYEIIMAATQQNWLYSLRFARAGNSGVMASNDYRLFSPVIIEDERHYRVSSWADAPLELELSDWRRDTELKLPNDANPLTRQYAKELRGKHVSDRSYVDAVLEKFNIEEYVYTLQPPRLGEHAMDEFLFQTRRGFCEHYAYAFVVMMRAAGIPARVIAGYQGGEINPVNSTVIVHQFDAHAWAEVWLPGEGWVRADPTAAVSPDRVEWGLERALASEGSFLSGSPLSPLRYRNIAWVNSLRLRYDALTWQWQSWIIGYDSERQYEFLGDLLGVFSAGKFVAIFLGTWAVVMIPVAWSLFGRRRLGSFSPEDKLYLVFCARLAKRGVSRQRGETPTQFAARASTALPVSAADINHITALYQDMAYANEGLSQRGKTELLGLLRRAVRSLKVPGPGIKKPA